MFSGTEKSLDEERILEEDMGIDGYDPNTSITSNSTVLSATDSVITANSCVLFINADTTVKDQLQLKKYQPKTSQISLIASIFLMVNTSLGAGLFNLPYVFYQSGGYWISMAIQMVIVLLIISSLVVLTYCTEKSKSNSYHEMIDKTLGKRWSTLSTWAIVLFSYGGCLTFILLISDQFKIFFLSYYGPNYASTWYLNTAFTTSVCSILFILPLCFSRGLDFLKWPSSAGFLIICYLIYVIFDKYLKTTNRHPVDEFKIDNWYKVFSSVPSICFSYHCHINWVPTYVAMNCKVKSVKTTSTIVISTGLCFIAYSLVAYMGITTFGGSNLHSDLIQNYDAKNTLVLIGIIAFAFKLISTYPIILFCAREAIIDYYLNFKKIDPNTPDESTRRMIKFLRYGTVLLWFFSSLILAELIPDLSFVISLLGTLTILFIFILPGLCLIKVAVNRDQFLETKKSLLLYVVASLFIMFGVFIFGLNAVQQFLN